MDLLKFLGIKREEKNEQNLLENALSQLKITPTNFNRALSSSSFKDKKGNVRECSIVNWRMLERNKYAPWGRGIAGGSQDTA